MRREMSEEDEFGMNKPGSFESDPMEIEVASAVKDHPDFAFVSKDALRELLGRRDEDALSAPWLQTLPTDSDPMAWTFLEVLIRPDRAWDVMQELVATVCIGHGMLLAEETTSSVLFRKKVGQDSMAHGMMDAATYQNLYVAIGVLPSKLRALHIGYLVSNEQKLLGSMTTSHFNTISSDRMKALNRSMDNLLAALQSTLTSQLLTSSYLYMTTPENSVDPGTDSIELDRGYISDVRKTFLREMKANMRELCIPLEEYAHQEEYAGALLLNLLDPLLKKHDINVSAGSGEAKKAVKSTVSEPTSPGDGPSTASTTEAATSTPITNNTSDTSRDHVLSTGKVYGEIITDMVQELWAKYKRECESKVKQKIDEKQRQVSARVQAVQRLRARALEAIVDHPEAEVTSLKEASPEKRVDVVLYDGTCVVNSTPVRLQITYGFIIYRSMVPLFARTTIVPFVDVVQVVHSTLLGIRVVNVNLKDNHPKGLTIATGIEVDLLHQLLVEILAAHKRDQSAAPRRPSTSSSPSNLHDLHSPNLETLIDAQEDEEKEDEADTSNDQATLQRLMDQAENEK